MMLEGFLAQFLLLLGLPSGEGGSRMGLDPGLVRLQRAYRRDIVAVGPNLLVWRDGSRMRYDDGRQKSLEEKLKHPDLEDQMSLPYPAGRNYPIPPRTDPGRIRYLPFFRKLYGASEGQVRQNLVRVAWLPAPGHPSVPFNRRAGAAAALAAVARELAKLPQRLRRFVARRPSTFVWRKVAGTNRLSAHAFGIALDLDFPGRAYWRWDLHGPLRRLRYRNTLPLAIVLAFERHGFIWGGKWAHYDTMHFEYRPELLVPVGP